MLDWQSRGISRWIKYNYTSKEINNSSTRFIDEIDLEENTLQTVIKTFLDFISNDNELSFVFFHSTVKKINVLILTETHMENGEIIDIRNFNFVASSSRPKRPAAGVAIYQNPINDIHVAFECALCLVVCFALRFLASVIYVSVVVTLKMNRW